MKLWALVEIERQTWSKYWPMIRHANLLQSWEYGDAKEKAQAWKPRRFIIRDESGHARGLVQVLTKTLPLAGGVARINRGPLLLSDTWTSQPPLEVMWKAIEAIREAAKALRWWYLSISPEFPALDKADNLLNNLGFRKKQKPAWGSALVHLEKDTDDIRTGLHGKWRNLLKKAERKGLELEEDFSHDGLDFLMRQYKRLQKQKNFTGVPEKIVRKMAIQNGQLWNVQVLYALKDKEPVGGILVVGHGDTCTYLIGWTSDSGKALQANYFMLWHAILIFKRLGYKWFDVGGLSSQTPKGIAHFKRRMQGREYLLMGEYILYLYGIKRIRFLLPASKS